MEEKKRTFFGRMFNKIWKKFDKDDVLTEDQEIAFDIFKINMQDKNNVFYLDYVSEAGQECKKYIVTKSYLINKDVNTFIVLNSGQNNIIIVNHQYRYNIPMPTKTCKIMDNIFNAKVREERDMMEKEILSNITESLTIVLKQFKEKLEKSNSEVVN
jgi:hypothetical protein